MKNLLKATAIITLGMSWPTMGVSGSFDPAVMDPVVEGPAQCRILWGLLPCSEGPYHVNTREDNPDLGQSTSVDTTRTEKPSVSDPEVEVTEPEVEEPQEPDYPSCEEDEEEDRERKEKQNSSERNGKGGNDGRGGKERDGSKDRGRGRS